MRKETCFLISLSVYCVIGIHLSSSVSTNYEVTLRNENLVQVMHIHIEKHKHVTVELLVHFFLKKNLVAIVRSTTN